MNTQLHQTRWFTALAGVFSLLALTSPAQNLLTNGDFENEPNWGNGVSHDADYTALTGNQLPGWKIETNHAATIQTPGQPYNYLTISGNYSLNTDGEGWNTNNANLYQDFTSQAGTAYALAFNWQSWSIAVTNTSQLEVSVVDTVTSAVLFNGLYSYDFGGPFPVHTVNTQFTATGNSLRLRIQQAPQSGYNDDMFVVDNFSVTVATNVGALLVNIAPSGAVSAGAQWQVDGGTFQASGAVMTNLPIGVHTVAFNSVAGWATPSNQFVQVLLGTTNLATATYLAGSGALQVSINPTGAVSAGAQWQVDGGALQTNGAVVTSLSVGNHTVAFCHVPGWTTPASQIVSVSANTTNPAAGTYPMLSASQLTYIWAHNAVGQFLQHCNNLYPVYWPSNSSWTQSYTTGDGCSPHSTVERDPSNWNPADTNTPSLDAPAFAGLYPGGVGLQGVNVILGPDTLAAGTYASPVHLVLNNMTMQATSALTFGFDITLNRIEFQGDGVINGGNFYIANGGTMVKSGGTGTYHVNGGVIGTNNVFEVDSGTLAFPSGFGNTHVNGTTTFAVSNNATMLLTVDSGATPFLSGTLTSVGGGTVLVNTGQIGSAGCNLNFPANTFQWTGGSLVAEGGPCTNSGIMNLTNSPGLNVIFYNNNLMNLADNSSFNCVNILNNNSGGTFNIQGNSSFAGGGPVNNYGLFKKSAGTGTSQIIPTFRNYGGTIEADTGTLALNMNNAGYYTNVTFVVSNGATIDFLTSNYSGTIDGNLTGSGGGTVLMNNGTVSSQYPTTLNFPGSMFQWAGGKFGGNNNNFTNLGTLNVSGPVAMATYFANSGIMILSGAGTSSGGNNFYNNAGAVYDIQNNNGISVGYIFNNGLFKKSAGADTSTIAANFYNYGPSVTLEVDSGTLALNNSGGNLFTNTSLVVSNGATLDLNTANNNTEVEGTFSGSGGGTVLMTNGTLSCNYAASMNFPGSMFQWQGGIVGSSSSFLFTNTGTLNISGLVRFNGYLANDGIMVQSGLGALKSGGSGLKNDGIYQIQNDSGVTNGFFNNYGLLEKTAGSGTSVISGAFNNYSAIEAASGTLQFVNGEFDHYAGTLQLTPAIMFGSSQNLFLRGGTITGVGTLGYTGGYNVNLNGGVLAPGNPFGAINVPGYVAMNSSGVLNIALGGPSQFSQLTVKNNIQLGGTLNVTLVNGYTPAIGTQFEIITNGGTSSSFASVNVPHGISLTYSNAGVYLTVTSAVPAQVVSPQLSGGNFGFSFGTVNGQSYTVQQNTNLAIPNWTFYTNIIGDGSPYQLILPVTAAPGIYFRVREP